jgi:hypothetical protein
MFGSVCLGLYNAHAHCDCCKAMHVCVCLCVWACSMYMLIVIAAGQSVCVVGLVQGHTHSCANN